MEIISDTARSSIPALGYAGTYAIANVLLTLAGSRRLTGSSIWGFQRKAVALIQTASRPISSDACKNLRTGHGDHQRYRAQQHSGARLCRHLRHCQRLADAIWGFQRKAVALIQTASRPISSDACKNIFKQAKGYALPLRFP
jgi:hypothetical protein